VKHLSRERLSFFFDKDIPPVLEVDGGEEIEVETEDAIAGQLTPATADTVSHAVMRSRVPCANPVTGPIFVRGAEPGDGLAVRILAIDPAPRERYAWTIFDPAESKRILPLKDGALAFRFRRGTIRVPVSPALGTIGVAPRLERRCSFLNGNVDVPSLGVGAILVLPVHVPGALLSLGDVHAVSGDGEISGGAADCRATVRIAVTVVKKPPFLPQPRLDDERSIGSLAMGGSLDTAVRTAYRDLVARLCGEHGFETVEAYQLLSSVGRVRIGQMIPPVFHTAVASVERRYLEMVDRA
jgi:acetamidase/formamidase